MDSLTPRPAHITLLSEMSRRLVCCCPRVFDNDSRLVGSIAAVNILLGLMPFLDNFAHIGGMFMGFLMGLALLVQKREDDLGDRLGKKCYQVRGSAGGRSLLS